MPNQVRVGFGITGANKAASDLDRLKGKFTALQKTTAKGFITGVGAGLGIGAWNAVGQAISGVAGYMGDAADAFREDEQSSQKLTTALRANAVGWDGDTKAIEKRIEAGQKLGFSDDEQRSSLAELVAAYGDVTKSLDVMRTAEDLARFSGVDLATASDVLIKVHAGNYRSLKALGINTKDIKDETQALAAVQKIAAGQAEDYANTLTGKLAVANEKANEAQEKFGAGLAKLQAIVIPAAADAVTGLADALDGITDPSRVLSNEEVYNAYFKDLGVSADQMGAALGRSSDDLAGVREQARLLAGVLPDTTNATDDLTGAVKDARSPTQKEADALRDMEGAAHDAEREIGDLADTIETGLYGKAINAGNLADLKEQHKELLKQRKEIKDHLSPAYIILTGKLAENGKAQFDLQLQMKETEGSDAVIAWLKTQIAKFGDADGALQKLIDKYRTLAKLQGTFQSPHGGSTKDAHNRRASGGPVMAGKAYTVGEQGPETFVAPTNGTIIPHGGASGGGTSGGSMGGTVVNINVSGVAMMTPGVTDQLGRMLEPVITRALQRRSQLASAQRF